MEYCLLVDCDGNITINGTNVIDGDIIAIADSARVWWPYKVYRNADNELFINMLILGRWLSVNLLDLVVGGYPAKFAEHCISDNPLYTDTTSTAEHAPAKAGGVFKFELGGHVVLRKAVTDYCNGRLASIGAKQVTEKAYVCCVGGNVKITYGCKSPNNGEYAETKVEAELIDEIEGLTILLESAKARKAKAAASASS